MTSRNSNRAMVDDARWPERARIPLLMYHSVDRVASDYVTVSNDVFQRHMEHLAAHYQTWSVAEAYGRLSAGDACTDQAVIVTFDDGLADNREHAAPLLLRYGVAATFFIIAGAIGQDNRWNRRAFRVMRHMDSGELKDLAAMGFDLQSHALTHHRLSKLPTEEIEHEFSESRCILEEATGVRPLAVSYPYGDADARCVQLAARHYELAFASNKQGHFDWRQDRFNVRRIYVSPQDVPADLDRKIACYRKGGDDG